MFTTGLGLVVTTTTRFDPTHMAAREKYYFDLIVEDYARQYREAGFVDGLSGIFDMFSKSKAPKIPWNEIYAEARPLAQQYARQEEENRIAEEGLRIQQERYTEIQKVSRAATEYKLPEGVTSISRGALVIMPKGGPVERRK